MHEMQTVLTDVRGVCLSVCPSVMWLESAVARAVYTACHVYGVIRCSLCQITLTTCLHLVCILHPILIDLGSFEYFVEYFVRSYILATELC